jgi:hypothetical protein
VQSSPSSTWMICRSLSLSLCVISGFCHEVGEISAHMGYYAASSGNFLAMFQDNQSVPSPRVKNPRNSSWILEPSWISWHLKMGQIGCPETSLRNYHSMLCNYPKKSRSIQPLVLMLSWLTKILTYELTALVCLCTCWVVQNINIIVPQG